eukprot:scaffold4722_cov417-Prasinococcus_capsulatus_cf.AAC.2
MHLRASSLFANVTYALALGPFEFELKDVFPSAFWTWWRPPPCDLPSSAHDPCSSPSSCPCHCWLEACVGVARPESLQPGNEPVDATTSRRGRCRWRGWAAYSSGLICCCCSCDLSYGRRQAGHLASVFSFAATSRTWCQHHRHICRRRPANSGRASATALKPTPPTPRSRSRKAPPYLIPAFAGLELLVCQIHLLHAQGAVLQVVIGALGGHGSLSLAAGHKPRWPLQTSAGRARSGAPPAHASSWPREKALGGPRAFNHLSTATPAGEAPRHGSLPARGACVPLRSAPSAVRARGTGPRAHSGARPRRRRAQAPLVWAPGLP